MHTRQHDHIGIDLRSLARQRQTVADNIGHAVEDFRCLVIMRKDNRIALFLQFEDRRNVVLEAQPLRLRQDFGHAIIELRDGNMIVHG